MYSKIVYGLVGWWPGNGNANDIVGNHHGTLQGGVTFVPGMVGQAFSLDGVDDLIAIADSADLNISGDVTVELWSKRAARII